MTYRRQQKLRVAAVGSAKITSFFSKSAAIEDAETVPEVEDVVAEEISMPSVQEFQSSEHSHRAHH